MVFSMYEGEFLDDVDVVLEFGQIYFDYKSCIAETSDNSRKVLTCATLRGKARA